MKHLSDGMRVPRRPRPRLKGHRVNPQQGWRNAKRNFVETVPVNQSWEPSSVLRSLLRMIFMEPSVIQAFQ